ncbi:hypothetical protein BDN71DRAFT_1432734 [Pleurotus eryngii]|uniref:Uncharacterized protein n=1 Tax=Pleurotus eryngii TaxID=5323 RepID=A0A9P6DF24_PLEER|nr:hypothetical protein BDN71DRAFT_1432734 [Pleurotus eryngii]
MKEGPRSRNGIPKYGSTTREPRYYVCSWGYWRRKKQLQIASTMGNIWIRMQGFHGTLQAEEWEGNKIDLHVLPSWQWSGQSDSGSEGLGREFAKQENTIERRAICRRQYGTALTQSGTRTCESSSILWSLTNGDSRDDHIEAPTYLQLCIISERTARRYPLLRSNLWTNGTTAHARSSWGLSFDEPDGSVGTTNWGVLGGGRDGLSHFNRRDAKDPMSVTLGLKEEKLPRHR